MNNLAGLLAESADPQLRDLPRAIELATKAMEMAPPAAKGDMLNTLGSVQYRAGHWASAIATLLQSAKLRSGGDANDFLFLAMAYWQLSKQSNLTTDEQTMHKEEARGWYEQAVEWMEKNKPLSDDLKPLRSEAEQLLRQSKN